MPTYLFLNKNTGEEFTEFMKISELDDYKEQNPHLEQLVYGAPSIGDSIRLGVRRPDDAFKDRLKEIKKSHRHSTVETY